MGEWEREKGRERTDGNQGEEERERERKQRWALGEGGIGRTRGVELGGDTRRRRRGRETEGGGRRWDAEQGEVDGKEEREGVFVFFSKGSIKGPLTVVHRATPNVHMVAPIFEKVNFKKKALSFLLISRKTEESNVFKLGCKFLAKFSD